ncbi:MAG: hypothetical protein HRF45_12510 [Fimbriimonadia bacterium]|jgi:hypothetical protein
MTKLLCDCGQPLVRRDLVLQEYYIRQFGPSFVYIKFRCRRCNRLGERFIRQEEWWPGVFTPRSREELHSSEREVFDALGPITESEHRMARRQLHSSNPLIALRAWVESSGE